MTHLALFTLFFFPAMTLVGQTARMITVAMCLLCCHPRIEKKLAEPGILLMVWLAWATLCSWYGNSFDMSLFGYYKRFEGLSMWLLAVSFGWLFWRSSSLNRLYLSIGAIFAVCLTVMLIEPKIYGGIIYGHITIAAFAAIGSCILMAKHPAFIACAIPFAFITGNRSIVIALLCGGGCYLALNWKKLPRKLIYAMASLFLIAALGVLPKLLTMDIRSLGKGVRTQVAMEAVQYIAMKPVMGYGIDTQSTLFGKNEHEKITHEIRGRVLELQMDLDRCHNIFLDVTMQTGFVGLAIWLFLLTRMAYRAFCYPSEVNTACLCGMAAFIGFNLANPCGIPSIFLACICITGIEKEKL